MAFIFLYFSNRKNGIKRSNIIYILNDTDSCTAYVHVYTYMYMGGVSKQKYFIQTYENLNNIPIINMARSIIFSQTCKMGMTLLMKYYCTLPFQLKIVTLEIRFNAISCTMDISNKIFFFWLCLNPGQYR